MNAQRYSLVIPIYNEQENLAELYSRLTAVMSKLGEPYEILFVDDGSRDNSRAMISQFASRDKSVRGVFFSRNFGHQPAIAAGIDHARGDAIITLDGDLQDPPEFIPTLVELWRKGNDVVFAVRKKRKESLLKRIAYQTFYRLLRHLANVDIPLDSGDFSLMDRKVADVLRAMPERNRFIRGLRSWAGFRQVGIDYEREARHAGEPKYTFRKLLRLAFDGFMSFSYVPLRLALWLGVLSFFASLSYISYAIYQKYVTHQTPPGWTSIAVAVMLLGGLQLMVLGVIGEYIARIYDEVKQRPYYIVSEKINCN